ncbi:MAG: penicillin-insensitive murein endopeptidase [Alphaproteobacteria bacterium]|nr:MAG: penicillin-insensitive murein endopeptidase [Alphaproteobacteria bacterium]
MRLGPLLALSAALLLGACGERADTAAAPGILRISTSNEPAKELFGPVPVPSAQPPEAIGSYARGCMAGAVQLPETGPTWQAMRLSRNRNWGTPELVAFIKRLSQKAAALPGWAGIYVGDMSQPRGGPMSSGHASHQIGLDADIWMLPPKRLDLTAEEREHLSSISTRRDKGAHVNDNWTPQHMALIRAAASDPAVARIFVFPGAKVWMCKRATGDRSWLRKVRPWYGHHYHFHVRLACPAGDRACVDQAPPPPGDGCAEAEGWVKRILNPPPPDPNAKPAPPRPPLTLSDLPAQCVSVLRSR